VVVDLVVERVDGVLVASWSGVVDEVRVGVSPDEPGEVVVHDGRGRLELIGVESGVRHYVHARVGDRWVVAGERLVPLEGTLNFRDLGGYRTGDGRRVRWGRVFRSDGLGSLTAADHAVLERLGVRTVCDLRADTEHEAHPSHLPGTAERVSCAVAPARPGQRTLDERIIAGELASLSVDDVVDLYLLMLDEYAPSFGRTLELIARADEPIVFHCAAGKDRTGIVAALLLALLGVPDDEIFDDYMLTKRYRSERRVDELRAWLAEHRLELEPFTALYIPQRDTIARTLEALRREHGTVDDFLVGPARARPDVPERLRQRLLVA
jgi:protein-tyrosine phosphatase